MKIPGWPAMSYLLTLKEMGMLTDDEFRAECDQVMAAWRAAIERPPRSDQMDVTVLDTNRDHHQFHEVDEVVMIDPREKRGIARLTDRVLWVNPDHTVAVFIEGRQSGLRDA
jgi:hypothetical protein